ncbi:MAG TPA: cupin domain-containing protein [Opitutaceae bacterium]|nr:cupin domain-containing protein [Opitutaceae bacterium]
MSLLRSTAQPFLRQATLQASFWFGSDLISVLAQGKDSAGALSVMEIAGLPGSEPPAHTHAENDELFHLLDGRLEFRVGDESVTLRRGDSLFLPRGKEHTYRVLTHDFHGLLFTSPSGIEIAYRNLSAPAECLRQNPSQALPATIDLINAFRPCGVALRARGLATPTTTTNPDLALRPRVGLSRWHRRSLFTPLVTSLESRTFTAFLWEGRTGSEPPRHVHHSQDEWIYLLEGEIEIEVGGDRWEVPPGSLAFLPQGASHSFSIRSRHVRALVVMTPSGFENFLTEFSLPATSLTASSPLPSPADDLRTWVNAGRRYGFSLAALD